MKYTYKYICDNKNITNAWMVENFHIRKVRFIFDDCCEDEDKNNLFIICDENGDFLLDGDDTSWFFEKVSGYAFFDDLKEACEYYYKEYGDHF